MQLFCSGLRVLRNERSKFHSEGARRFSTALWTSMLHTAIMSVAMALHATATESTHAEPEAEGSVEAVWPCSKLLGPPHRLAPCAVLALLAVGRRA